MRFGGGNRWDGKMDTSADSASVLNHHLQAPGSYPILLFRQRPKWKEADLLGFRIPLRGPGAGGHWWRSSEGFKN